MKCKQCGHEISGNVRFCNQCGLQIDRDPPTPISQAPLTDSTGSNQHLTIGEHTDADSINSTNRNDGSSQKRFITWKVKNILIGLAAIFVLSAGTGLVVRYVKGINTEMPVSNESKEGGEGTVVVSNTVSENTDGTNVPIETEAVNAEAEIDLAEEEIHQYSYHIDDCTWSEAFLNAKEMGGYLVRINTREEYSYILTEIIQQGYEKKQFLLGGRRSVIDLNYYWVDEDNSYYGHPINDMDNWTNTEWLQGEPSFKDGDIEEEYLCLYYNSREQRWGLNDVPDAIIEIEPKFSGLIGYIVEYGSR
ncbi:MAG: hypothetical protein K0M69_11285 [Youngiibacter sp.]|nr:hypothetical protein [Youngiibacter sp.]